MAIYNDEGNLLNTVYDVDGNILASIYDKDGNLLDGTIFSDSTTITNVYTSTSTLQSQGGCIDDDGNIYACLYVSGDFIKYNLSTGTETIITPTGASGSEPWGHANGMTYNPNTEYFYVASQNDTGEVYVFDASFNLVDTLYAKNANNSVINCWNICYDRISERFIVLSGLGVMYFYDNSFDLVSTGTYDQNDWELTRQDIETDGTYIYCVSWNSNKLFVFDMSGNLVKEISNTSFGGEPEAMCYDWETGNFYIEGKDSYYVIRQAVFKGAVIQ